MHAGTDPSPQRLCKVEQSQLLIVDVQARLAAAMPKPVRERVLRNITVLITAAEALEVPILVSEQYPQGLGRTDQAIATALPRSARTLDKTSFSCCQAAPLQDALAERQRRQVIVAGMESHICVLQTALGLIAAGYTPFVVADACCARSVENHDNALQRLRQAGVTVTNTESTLFEWLGDASHPHFKTLSKLIR